MNKAKESFVSSAIRRSTFLCGVALVAIAALPNNASAQDSTAAPDEAPNRVEAGEGVILVQARRQNERLQDVPVTITSVSGELMDKFVINQVSDMVARVPTMTVQVGGAGSGGQLSLRGIGSSNISAAFDSAVAFDFDGVQLSTMRLVQAGFFDMKQIDVLKGPQSLYFGKSSTAGVFALQTADPTPDWEVGMMGNYEFEERGYILNGYISGPITDTLGIRLAAQWNDISRLIEMDPALNNGRGRFRGQSELLTRLTLDWKPEGNFDANLKLQYMRNEGDGAVRHTSAFCGQNGVADPLFLLGGAAAFPAGYDCNFRNNIFFIPDAAPPTGAGPVPGNSRANGWNGVPFNESDIWFGRLLMNLQISDAIRLTSTTGFLDMDAFEVDCYEPGGIGPAFSPIGNLTGNPNFLATAAPALAAANGPGVPLGAGCQDPTNKLRQFTQELRLHTDFDGPVNFMLGAFYEDRRFVLDLSQTAVNISYIAPDPVTGFTWDWQKRHVTKTEAISLFGSVIFDVTEDLELVAGARWTDETKVNTIQVPFLHTFLQGPNFVSPGFFSGPIPFRDSNISPEVTLKYRVNPDFNVFAAFRTGFKSGGIDNSALPSNSLSQAAIANDFSALIFDSETTIGGEIGFRSQWANRTLTVNGTAYYYVVDDLQVQNLDSIAIQFITLNAGQLTTQGFDLEFNWRTPIDGLTISGNGAYLDARFTDTFISAAGQDLNGRAAPRAPEWSGNLAFDWNIPIGKDLNLFLGGNMLYSSSYFADQQTLSDFRQSDYVTVDANISIGRRDGRWRASLIGVNLTDELFVITSGPRPFLSPGGPGGFGLPRGDDILVTMNRGRQIFVQTSFRF
ncbi:MAG: TonB-dependent receptor [Erythrobacter sp.]